MAATIDRPLSPIPSSVGVAPRVAAPKHGSPIRTALSLITTMVCPLAAINAYNPLTTIIQRGAADAKAILALTPETISLLTIIRRFPETEALYQKAADTPSLSEENQKRTGAYRFRFTSLEHEHSFGADVCGKEREIRIDLAQARRLLPASSAENFTFIVAIVELTNATNMPALQKLIDDLHANKITADKYAKEAQRIEHQGVLLHHTIMKNGIETYRWDPSLDVYAGKEADFERYWETIKDNSHTELCRTEVKVFVRARIERVMKNAKMRQEKIEAILELPYEDLEGMHLHRSDEELLILLNGHIAGVVMATASAVSPSSVVSAVSIIASPAALPL